MGKPLDNPSSVATRPVIEASSGRSDPVVEFARRKAPGYATDTFDDHEHPDIGTAERESAPLRLVDLPEVSLPKDNNRPLVTSNERYTKEALEAYKSLRTRLLRSQANQGFRSIAVTSVGKAEGKTLTAFNLACCCAQVENLTVLLIDGDLRSRSLTTLIGGLPSVGLANVMSGTSACEAAVVRTDVPNLFVMGAGTSDVSPTELFSSERWNHVIRWSRHNFKVVLVDALSIGAFADFELIAPECDGILMVVRARSTSREALKTAVEQIDAQKLIGIVWNGSESANGDRLY